MGANIVAVSPQRKEFLLEVIKKNHITFDVLSDAGNTVAAQFGLRFSVSGYLQDIYRGFGLDLAKFNGDDSWTLPMPGRFIIDSSSTVRYAEADPDYTVRPEPTDTLQFLKTLQG